MEALRLDNLPTEILYLIIGDLPISSIRNFASANQRCRQISLPYIFSTVRFQFSYNGFRQLETIAKSHIAKYVKVLHYEASEIVDPCKSSI